MALTVTVVTSNSPMAASYAESHVVVTAASQEATASTSAPSFGTVLAVIAADANAAVPIVAVTARTMRILLSFMTSSVRVLKRLGSVPGMLRTGIVVKQPRKLRQMKKV